MHPRQTRLLRSAFTFIFFFAFIPPFGFIGDRPSRVFDPQEEGFFARTGQWISAVSHLFLAVFVLATYGVWGFVLLPLTVLVVARRLSAMKGIPYFVQDLRGDISELLAASRIKSVVLYGTAGTLALDIATLFGLPTNFLSAAASVGIWGTWMFLAFKAAKMNVSADQDKRTTRFNLVGMLSKSLAVPVSEWENSEIVDEGMRITVTPPPLGAVLHYAQADSILALIAPQYEINLAESNHEQLVLDATSEETQRRREEERLSGGLIAGKLSDQLPTSAAPAFAGVSITKDDLL
jgi:hypothetical protein